jgi:hypothetical protein
MRLVESGGEPDFPQEALSPQRLGQLRVQHLDRDPALMLDPVAFGERGREAFVR